MKNSKIIFVLTLVTFTSLNFAQGLKVGLKAGVNFSNYTGSDVNTNNLTSFHGGLVLEAKIFKNFGIQPELLYSTQGAEVDALGNQIKNELGYISIPVLAKFNLNDNLSLELGPQVSFLLNERNNFSLKDSNTFDFAVAGGLSYKFGKHFFISGRYGLGLTEPKRDASVKNSVVQASLGFML
jgi:hypothetical protein